MQNSNLTDRSTRTASVMSFIIAGILIIGWPISMIVSWSSIVNSDSRLGYLIGDLGVVSPLFLAAAIGLHNEKRWGSLVLLLGLGAITYDVVHFTIYLIKIGFLKIPGIVYLLILAVLLIVFYFMARARIKYLL